MKTIFVQMTLVLVFGIFSITHGQDTVRPLNLIGANVLGNASLVSMNYERIFVNRTHFFLATNTGLGIHKEFILFNKHAHLYGTISNTLTANFGKKIYFFEVGLGATMLANDKDIFGFAYPIVGFRIHPLYKKRFFFKFHSEFPIKLTEPKRISGVDELFFNRVFFFPIGFQIGIAF